MANVNKTITIGTLTRDPELKYTAKGTAIASFGMAVNRNYLVDGEKREEVTFIDFDAFGKTAEVIGQYAKKGGQLFVEGHLKTETWDDKQSGQKRSKMKVVVDSIQLLGGKKDGESQPRQQGRPASAPRPPADPDLDAEADDIPF